MTAPESSERFAEMLGGSQKAKCAGDNLQSHCAIGPKNSEGGSVMPLSRMSAASQHRAAPGILVSCPAGPLRESALG